MEPEMEYMSTLVNIMIAAAIILAIVGTAVKAWIFCKIFSKTGYSWTLGLLILVPIANLIMPLVLAFSDWPICREVRVLRQRRNDQSA